MTTPLTLMQLAQVDLAPGRVAQSSLILIDYQNEYLAGPLALPGARPAVAAARRLLDQARASAAPIFHVVHGGRAGGLFDLSQDRGRIIADLQPRPSETVIEKTRASAFVDTPLAEHLRAAGRNSVVIAGFMTHNCVSSTARAARDLGWRVTVDATASATRALPDGQGGEISALDLHRAALIGLSDANAVIAWDQGGVL